MYSFIIYLFNKEFEMGEVVLCKSVSDLALFLEHLDTDKYNFDGDIQVIPANVETDFKKYCKSLTDDLEFGG
jgi:hypothetical protein